MLKYLIFEAFICAIHSPPKLNVIFLIPNTKEEIPYSLDVILTIFPLLRAYLLYRVFIGGSFWSDQRAEQICREDSRANGGPAFALKCELKERPFILIMFTLVILIYVFGFGIRSAEL